MSANDILAETHIACLERRRSYLLRMLDEAGPQRALGMHFDRAEVEAITFALKIINPDWTPKEHA